MEFPTERMVEMCNRQIEVAKQFNDSNTAAIAARNRSFMSDGSGRVCRRWVSKDESVIIALEVVDFEDTWQVMIMAQDNDTRYKGKDYDQAVVAFDQAVSEQ